MRAFGGCLAAFALCLSYPAIGQDSTQGRAQAAALEEVAAMPVWNALLGDNVQIMYFAFADGHSFYRRTVQIEQKPDGTGYLWVSGTVPRHSVMTQEKSLPIRRLRLSVEKMADISRMAEESGAFDFEDGIWGDPTRIIIHCDDLEMKRVNAEGYRSSQVYIGCNRPKKLAPLLSQISRLAQIDITGG